MSRTIVIGAGFDEDLAYFHLKSISVAEEEAFVAAMAESAGLEGEEKTKAELATCLEAIASWSERSLTKKVKDVHVDFYDNASTNEAVTKYFGDLETGDAYRLASQITYAFRLKLQPQVIFQ